LKISYAVWSHWVKPRVVEIGCHISIVPRICHIPEWRVAGPISGGIRLDLTPETNTACRKTIVSLRGQLTDDPEGFPRPTERLPQRRGSRQFTETARRRPGYSGQVPPALQRIAVFLHSVRRNVPSLRQLPAIYERQL